MTAPPPRILVAIAVSLIAVVVLAAVALGGSDDAAGPGGGGSTSTTAATTTSRAAPETLAPVPITVLPDWYRKGSSRYDERRPTTTVPPAPADARVDPEPSAGPVPSEGN